MPLSVFNILILIVWQFGAITSSVHAATGRRALDDERCDATGRGNHDDDDSHNNDKIDASAAVADKEELLGHSSPDPESMDVVLIKVGGSSITKKAERERIDEDAMGWLCETLSSSISPLYKTTSTATTMDEDDGSKRTTAFIVVHGGGSFGHHVAKEYGLTGKTEPPPKSTPENEGYNDAEQSRNRRRRAHGLARARLSVQRLNRRIVSELLDGHGINAVGISPCFAVPGLQAHGGDLDVVGHLEQMLRSTLSAGFVPVLQGDGCLYGERDVGILSGDAIMEMLGARVPWISRVVFVTDVDGVYTRDPKLFPDSAMFLPEIGIHPDTGMYVLPEPAAPGEGKDDETVEVGNELVTVNADDGGRRVDSSVTGLDASGSSHEHDVTGGLRTKLASAASIALSGKNVTIVKCRSESAEWVLRSDFVARDHDGDRSLHQKPRKPRQDFPWEENDVHGELTMNRFTVIYRHEKNLGQDKNQ